MDAKNSMLDCILRMAQVIQVTGMGRSSVYNKANPKSPHFDPTWPKPVRLSARAVGYRQSELMAWLAQRPRARAIDEKE